MKTRTIIILIIVFGIILALLLRYRHMPQAAAPAPADTSSAPIAVVHYDCDQGKTIDAQYYEGSSTPAEAGQPPMPGGSVHLVLSDGRELSLKQTISADGIRYSDGDPSVVQGNPGAESFVFWSKGNTALVLEHNVDQTYLNCVAATSTAAQE